MMILIILYKSGLHSFVLLYNTGTSNALCKRRHITFSSDLYHFFGWQASQLRGILRLSIIRIFTTENSSGEGSVCSQNTGMMGNG